MRIKNVKTFILTTIAAVTAAVLSACASTPNTPTVPGGDTPPDTGDIKPSYSAPTFITADGSELKNAKGETVYLRGVNAGGLFVTEHWMTGFIYGSTPSNDYRSLTQTLIGRFGEENTQALWREYRECWWTEQDFETCASMGFNSIRLPFTYMNVDFSAVRDNNYADAGKAYDFSAIDDFVETAAKYGMYTILDLHGAYGSQNGQDHSGQIIGSASDVGFYSDERMMQLTADLWSAIAEHYKDNPAVAAYDILNEPGEKAGLTSERHFECFDKLCKTIRATGDNHVVIFESCWDGKDLPHPAEYGWENCMYSFHHYADDKLSLSDHCESWHEKLQGVTDMDFGVPLHMGEFTNYTNVEKWEYTLDLMNRSDWSWTSWTYKVWGNMPWGVVNLRGTNEQKVNVSADSFAEILDKFALLRSDSEIAQKYAFKAVDTDGEPITLERVFRKYATAPKVGLPEAGEYKLVHNDMWLNADSALRLTDDYNLGKTLKIAYSDSADGGATLTVGGKSLYAANVDGVVKVLCGKTSNNTAALFYPVLTERGEIAFVSRFACKYLRLAEDGTFVADAASIADACLFEIGE